MSEGGKGWYDVVTQGMEHAGGVTHKFPTGEGKRYAFRDWNDLELIQSGSTTKASVTLPDWITKPAPTVPAANRTISPSELGGAKALPSERGMDEDTAKAYGNAVHILLEHLPRLEQADWPSLAPRIIEQSRLKLPENLVIKARAEAITSLNNQQLKDLFAPDTLAEVSITADLGDDRIHGTIDRLIVTDDTVIAVDFKTNRATPNSPEETPAGLLRQLGAHAHALRQIHPTKAVRTEILWTAAQKRMHYPEDLIDAALRNRVAP